MDKLTRRKFLQSLATHSTVLTFIPLVGCGSEKASTESFLTLAANTGDVVMYDTYAMALYFDGTMGPKTGIIKVQYILDGVAKTLDFWHGHGGKQHQFTLTSTTYDELKTLKKVTLETTVVDGHKHKLFIDPNDPRYRVPGAQPIPVPVFDDPFPVPATDNK